MYYNNNNLMTTIAISDKNKEKLDKAKNILAVKKNIPPHTVSYDMVLDELLGDKK